MWKCGIDADLHGLKPNSKPATSAAGARTKRRESAYIATALSGCTAIRSRFVATIGRPVTQKIGAKIGARPRKLSEYARERVEGWNALAWNSRHGAVINACASQDSAQMMR